MVIGSHFPAIDLATVTSGWSLQRRSDAKYIVEIDALTKLLDATDIQFAQLEIDGKRSFEYATTYFDSNDLDSYKMHLAGKRQRFKVRHRHYVDTDLHRFEVKTKVPRGQTQKYILDNHHSLDQTSSAFVAQALTTAYGTEYLSEVNLNLEPVVDIFFNRSTLVLSEFLDRVTIDTGLVSQYLGRQLKLKSDYCILELKSEEVRSRLHSALLGINVRPRKLSKYLVTIDALNTERPRGITDRDLDLYFMRD